MNGPTTASILLAPGSHRAGGRLDHAGEQTPPSGMHGGDDRFVARTGRSSGQSAPRTGQRHVARRGDKRVARLLSGPRRGLVGDDSHVAFPCTWWMQRPPRGGAALGEVAVGAS